MAGKLEGKVALVTGAGSGIGRASALKFAQEGAQVAVNDISVAGGEETARLIAAGGGEAVFIRADMSQAEEIEELFRRTLEIYGRLDCAHNHVGGGGTGTRVADMNVEDWDRSININTTSVFRCMKHELRQMVKQGGGAIVNTASVAGLTGVIHGAAYSAGKHGVIGLTREAALEYAKDGIRVNAICPGATASQGMMRGIEGRPTVAQRLTNLAPMGRMGTPEEQANAAVWLCTPAASYMSGHALVVDGATYAW